MLNGRFPIYLDGQEAQMIIFALNEKADRMRTPQVAGMYRHLSNRIAAGKLEFHGSTYQAMAVRYGLPAIAEVAAGAVQME